MGYCQDLVDHFEHQPSRSGRDAEPSGRNPADLRERLAAAQAALAAREAARVPPLLQDAHPEVGGGVQVSIESHSLLFLHISIVFFKGSTKELDLLLPASHLLEPYHPQGQHMVSTHATFATHHIHRLGFKFEGLVKTPTLYCNASRSSPMDRSPI